MADAERRPILRSRRILLRAAEPDDLPLFVEWLNDADVRETLGGSAPISAISEETWFEDLQKEQGKTRWHFTICLRGDGRPIGFGGLHSVDSVNGQAELGIGIGDRSLWNQGYGSEAVGTLLDFGFGELRLHRVVLHVFAGNDRAQHVYQKLGFSHEGTLRQAMYQHGRHIDVHVMGILRDEWSSGDRPRTWEIE